MRTLLSILRISFLPAAAQHLLLGVVACLVIFGVFAQPLSAQAPQAQPGNPPNALLLPGGGQGAIFGGPGPAGATGQAGGAAMADFDSLIDLIEATVAPESWDVAGGQGDIRPFFGGVLVDAAGTLQLRGRTTAASRDLAAKRGTAPGEAASAAGPLTNARQASALRYISLPRLEREIARRQAAREPLEQEMLTLAGLQRVEYVFVYPESGDLVLAGPAGDWLVDPEGRIVSTDTRLPVVRLDDLLVLLRRGLQGADSFFGCSINPRQEALAKTQAFLAASSERPLQPGQRSRWLGQLRDAVGLQDIEIFGIDPASRIATVLVEADYHMKLIGMGLEEGVNGVESYLDLVKWASELRGGTPPQDMSVLRWWFALNYESIGASPDGDAFELVGQGARVLSENELLAEQGQRVGTGDSEPLNRQFAESFTANFAELAAKYPIYGELRNIFDLAMAVSLIKSNGLVELAGWQPSLFADGEKLRVPHGPVPRQVETVVNHRTIDRRHFVAGVSGGVMVATADVLRAAPLVHSQGLVHDRETAAPSELAAGIWWWDAAE